MIKPPSSERRQFGRRDSRVHGVCTIPGRAPMHCIVKNLSPAGALIEFNEPIKVPFNFRLRIESRQLDHACHVRHQGQHGVGVTFVDCSGARPGARTDASGKTGATPDPVDASTSVHHGHMPDSDLRREMFGDAHDDAAPSPVRDIDAQPGRIIRGL